MKFGKWLKQQIQETLPGWCDKFLSYKELKKLVRLISSAPPRGAGAAGHPAYGRAEAEFMYLLHGEIEKFNSFFVEKEEDFIIRHRVSSLSLPFSALLVLPKSHAAQIWNIGVSNLRKGKPIFFFGARELAESAAS